MGKKYWRKVRFWSTFKQSRQYLNERQQFKTFSNSVKVTSQARKKRIACESSDVICCQLPPPLHLPPSLLLSSFSLPHTPHSYSSPFPPSSHPATHLHHHHHTPPTPAVHTLRPPLNVGPAGTLSKQLRHSPIIAFGAITAFTTRRIAKKKKNIMWRAAVRNDKCDFDSNFLTPFCWNPMLVS